MELLELNMGTCSRKQHQEATHLQYWTLKVEKVTTHNKSEIMIMLCVCVFDRTDSYCIDINNH